jgi:YD repeat-containing protein
MRSRPNSWTSTLTKLGFRRQRHKSKQLREICRRPRIESLESRQMMAADYLVTTHLDVVNGSDDVLSLREAIAAAANDGQGDVDDIEFAPNVVTQGRISLSAGEITLNSSVNLIGPGAGLLTIDAHQNSRVFVASAGTVSTLSDLTITGGNSFSVGGGGIVAAGDLTLNRVVVANNQAGNGGGGVYVDVTGELTVNASTFYDNDAGASGSGGAIGGQFGAGQKLVVADSTFYENTANNGGAIKIQGNNGGTATQVKITNSTFSGNIGTHSGAALSFQSFVGSPVEASIVNSTVVHNQAQASVAGGIFNIDPSRITVSLHNTILAKNTSADANFRESWGSLSGTVALPSSNNLIGVGAAGVHGPGIQQGVHGNLVGTSLVDIDPRLTPLGDHGGKTKTHALLPTSPAIDAGSAAKATAFGLTHDQRGSQFKRQVIGGVDIGAIEAYVAQLTPTSAIVIHGTDGADGITIGVNVAGQSVVALDSTGGVEMPVNLTSAASVTVYANGGDDAVSVQTDLTKPITIHGGAGEDMLRGGAGNDKLVGGLGADVLVGGDGDDNLYGAHDTSVVLSDGADTLFGDGGADTLHVDYLPPTHSHPYTAVGGDVFEANQSEGDVVMADSGATAPAPTGSTWQQTFLWNGNYGFGAGWNVVGIDRLEFSGSATTATSLQWVRADGHTVTMTRPTTSDPWTAVSGDPSASEITFNATTQKFTRSDKHGNVSEYLVSATGLAMVVKAVDRLGVGRKYAYSDHDVDGAAVELDSIAIVRTGQVDEVTNYNYTTVSGNHQRVTSIVDPFGRITTIEYGNGDGKITSVKLPEIAYVPSELDAMQRFHAFDRPTTNFTHDVNGFVNSITVIEQDDPGYEFDVTRNYNWQTNGELWVLDEDVEDALGTPTPIRYRGAPTDVYTQWMEKTDAWAEFLPASILTDGLAGMGATDVKQGYTVDEVGRTTLLHYNRDGGVVWKQDPTGSAIEIVRSTAGLPEQVAVKAPGDQRIVDQTSYDYDASHNLVETTYFDGTQTTRQYDPNFSQLAEAVDELGRRTVFAVNASTPRKCESSSTWMIGPALRKTML